MCRVSVRFGIQSGDLRFTVLPLPFGNKLQLCGPKRVDHNGSEDPADVHSS